MDSEHVCLQMVGTLRLWQAEELAGGFPFCGCVPLGRLTIRLEYVLVTLLCATDMNRYTAKEERRTCQVLEFAFSAWEIDDWLPVRCGQRRYCVLLASDSSVAHARI